MSLPAAAPAAEVSGELNIPSDPHSLASCFIASLVPPRPDLCRAVLNKALSCCGKNCNGCEGRFTVDTGTFAITFQQLKQIRYPDLILRQVVEEVSGKGRVLEGSLSLDICLYDGIVLLLWVATINVEEG